MDEYLSLKRKAYEARLLAVDAVHEAKAGHPGGSLSCLDALTVLYFKEMKIDPANPSWEDRDRFILSKGHAGLALYGVMEKAGLISNEKFNSYLTSDSQIGGEPCMRDSEWVEAATGSLGHGLSVGLGMAMALKLNKSSAKVYVLLGDGELQEGTVWEAVMTAPAFQADNLVAVLDNNGIQKMDFVERVVGTSEWREKFEAFGWDVLETDGHDIEAFRKAALSENRSGKPRLIIAHTVKGKGVSLMENNPIWHFRIPGRKELKVFKKELGITDAELE